MYICIYPIPQFLCLILSVTRGYHWSLGAPRGRPTPPTLPNHLTASLSSAQAGRAPRGGRSTPPCEPWCPRDTTLISCPRTLMEVSKAPLHLCLLLAVIHMTLLSLRLVSFVFIPLYHVNYLGLWHIYKSAPCLVSSAFPPSYDLNSFTLCYKTPYTIIISLTLFHIFSLYIVPPPITELLTLFDKAFPLTPAPCIVSSSSPNTLGAYIPRRIFRLPISHSSCLSW